MFGYTQVYNVQIRLLATSSPGMPMREWVTAHGLTGYRTEKAAEDAAAEWLVNGWPTDPEYAIQTRVVCCTEAIR